MCTCTSTLSVPAFPLPVGKDPWCIVLLSYEVALKVKTQNSVWRKSTDDIPWPEFSNTYYSLRVRCKVPGTFKEKPWQNSCQGSSSQRKICYHGNLPTLLYRKRKEWFRLLRLTDGQFSVRSEMIVMDYDKWRNWGLQYFSSVAPREFYEPNSNTLNSADLHRNFF